VAEDKGLPAAWGPDQNVAWKADIPGRGWSSPVVWGKQVWLTTAPPDGKALYAYRRGELPAHVIRLDLGTGEKHPSQELMPPDAAGVVEIVSVVLTPDVSSYAYSYHRILSDLFLVEGLK